jgi:hypothetical protein
MLLNMFLAILISYISDNMEDEEAANEVKPDSKTDAVKQEGDISKDEPKKVAQPDVVEETFDYI